MFLKTEIMAQVDQFRRILNDATDSASRDIAAIGEQLQAAQALYLEQTTALQVRRNAIDTEMENATQALLAKLNESVVSLATIRMAMGAAPPDRAAAPPRPPGRLKVVDEPDAAKAAAP